MDINIKAKPKVTLSAVITRADGTIEDLGVIASSETGSLRHRFVAFIKRLLKKG